MKKFVFALCVVMLLKPIIPVIEYVCNYDYIANELCENKDNVVMGCNGKCYLMKQLAKESETEKPLSSDKKHLQTETSDLFFHALQDFDLVAIEDSNSVQFVGYANFYAHLQTNSHFHPPTVIA